VFATAGAGGTGPALGCNRQAQQTIGSAEPTRSRLTGQIAFSMLSSSYTATWSYLRTSARKQSSESVGHIVAEETCSFRVRSGFQSFFPNFFQRNFPNFSKLFGKTFSGKMFGKKWFRPYPYRNFPEKTSCFKLLFHSFQRLILDCSTPATNVPDYLGTFLSCERLSFTEFRRRKAPF
jgi:hypothetical protein